VANIKGFISDVQARYGWRPVVPFQTSLLIGDIGRIDKNGAWSPVSTTRDRFGLLPEGIRPGVAEDVVWDLISGNDVQFHTYGKGETSKLITNVADAKVRAEIEFKSSKSFVFAARDVTTRSATKFDKLITAIRAAYHNREDLPEDRRWDENLVFIFAIANAARFVAVLADQTNTALAATGSGSVGPPADPSRLAAGVRFGASSKQLQKVNAANAKGCFYRAFALKPSVFRSWDEDPLVDVHFARSRWLGGGYRFTASDIPTSPAALFGEPTRFADYGGSGEVGYTISPEPPTEFDDTFREI